MSERKSTQQEVDDYCNAMLLKMKRDPQYDLKIELGKLLMRHIDTFTEQERKRYDELHTLLGITTTP